MPTGRIYYLNHNTQTTTWEKPRVPVRRPLRQESGANPGPVEQVRGDVGLLHTVCCIPSLSTLLTLTLLTLTHLTLTSPHPHTSHPHTSPSTSPSPHPHTPHPHLTSNTSPHPYTLTLTLPSSHTSPSHTHPHTPHPTHLTFTHLRTQIFLQGGK